MRRTRLPQGRGWFWTGSKKKNRAAVPVGEGEDGWAVGGSGLDRRREAVGKRNELSLDRRRKEMREED
ncbi:hypothetical protein L484_004445 [Morus notabilis]|uniref:Uncharacterized protein n=1 Tax=Morus notabilis TaxID=981085 RepID=W9S818_9ROSA|nr:hypothetical protein L484_004445 [Morus notabilis]